MAKTKNIKCFNCGNKSFYFDKCNKFPICSKCGEMQLQLAGKTINKSETITITFYPKSKD